ALKDAQVDEKALARQQAIILSMTKAERERPEQLLNASRKKSAIMSRHLPSPFLNCMGWMHIFLRK
ncbi:MAG: hypothetical protein II203_00405, partial [Phascolarctobacterium sp.]|nr:hypothetical protein [Phascolarctobacterium sp.]